MFPLYSSILFFFPFFSLFFHNYFISFPTHNWAPFFIQNDRPNVREYINIFFSTSLPSMHACVCVSICIYMFSHPLHIYVYLHYYTIQPLFLLKWPTALYIYINVNVLHLIHVKAYNIFPLLLHFKNQIFSCKNTKSTRSVPKMFSSPNLSPKL